MELGRKPRYLLDELEQSPLVYVPSAAVLPLLANRPKLPPQGPLSLLTVGNPATGDVSLGPIIDAKQRDRIHALVTDSVGAGAKLLTGGKRVGARSR